MKNKKIKLLKKELLNENNNVRKVLKKYFKFTDKITTDNNIALKNETCKYISNEVRKKLNKKDNYEVDEYLICRFYYKTKNHTFNVNFKYKIIKIDNNNISTIDESMSDKIHTLKIDDINRQFSDADGNPSEFINLLELNSGVSYDNILVRVSSLDNTEIQLTELVLLNDGSNSFLVEKSTLVNTGVGLTHISGEPIGEFILIEDDVDDNTYLRFIPNDPFNIDYDVKNVNNIQPDESIKNCTQKFLTIKYDFVILVI